MTAAAATTVGETMTPAEIQAANAIGRPTKRDEAWRYAPHRDLARMSFGSPVVIAGGIPADVEAQIPAIDSPRIVIINGAVDLERSDMERLPDALAISTLAEAGTDNSELIDALVARDSEATDAYDSLNASFGSDGVVVQVKAGGELEVPIHIVHVVVPGVAPNASASRVVLHVGAGSSATVVETRVGGGGTFGASNDRTSISLDDNASLEHVVLQDAPSQQIHLGRIEVAQAAGSVFIGRSFNLGALYSRISYDVHLNGVGAVAELTGLYFGFGDQILDQQINIVHASKDCTSRQSFRGVLDDESTGVFNGGIDVRPGADGTEAEQSNANLLLSRRAEANTQPRLEILADDVKCKHGATVGQLDESALYYLRSRGIDADHARRMLIGGFADLFVDEVDIDVVQAWIRKRLRGDDG